MRKEEAVKKVRRCIEDLFDIVREMRDETVGDFDPCDVTDRLDEAFHKLNHLGDIIDRYNQSLIEKFKREELKTNVG